MNTDQFKFALTTILQTEYSLKKRQMIEHSLDNLNQLREGNDSTYKLRVSFIDDNEFKIDFGIVSTSLENPTEADYLSLFEEILDKELTGIVAKHETYIFPRRHSVLKLDLDL